MTELDPIHEDAKPTKEPLPETENEQTAEEQEWSVLHLPLRKTVYSGIEMIRWEVGRSEIKWSGHTPWVIEAVQWTALAIFLVCMTIFLVIVVLVETINKLRGKEPANEEEESPVPKHDHGPRDHGPRDLVLLTSTGIVVEGRYCGVWSAAGRGLEKVELVEDDDDHVLRLGFRKRGEIAVVVPEELVKDVSEIVTLLESKTYDAKLRQRGV